jgi:uncharacterized DUF497 family protein
MKNLIILMAAFFLCTSFKSDKLYDALAPIYDSEFVEISTVNYKDERYNAISMKREGNRVRAKYFAAADRLGKSVFNRYSLWATGKNVILVSSGTYMDQSYITPEGLTIDNGIPVNETLITDRMDALVIVYTNGGIAVSNLKVGDLSLTGINIDSSRKFNLRKSSWDKDDFMEWAKAEEATVFQTHLLVYKNKLALSSVNSSTKSQERRFLAVGENEEGKLIHVIVHCPKHSTLYDGAERAFRFLKDFKDMDVTFMINLDTGYQDVFKLYNKDGTTNQTISGKENLNRAVNLLTYYFQ